MSPFTSTKNKINPRNILGGILGGFEDDGYEKENSFSVAGVLKDVGDIVFEGLTEITQTVTESKQIAPTGTIEFKQKQAKAEKDQKETNRKHAFIQALKEDQQRAENAKNRMLSEDEINDIVSNLPTDEKNRMLHYQASYKDRSIYQKSELRKKLIEESKKTEKQKKDASIPSPAKKISALDGAFEGSSGSVGSGTANFGKGSVQ